MASTKKPPETDGAPFVVNGEARALVDIPSMGVLCGGLIVAEPIVIASLVSGGEADDSPEAIAYAKAQADAT